LGAIGLPRVHNNETKTSTTTTTKERERERKKERNWFIIILMGNVSCQLIGLQETRTGTGKKRLSLSLPLSLE